MPARALWDFSMLRRQLAAQMAEANFHIITARPAWTLVEMEGETDCAITRMDVAARDLLAAQGAEPLGANWQAIWTAMEAGYRETTASLLRAHGLRGEDTLH